MVQTATPFAAAGESRCGRLIRQIWVRVPGDPSDAAGREFPARLQCVALRPHGVAVSTPAFHAGSGGSIPPGGTVRLDSRRCASQPHHAPNSKTARGAPAQCTPESTAARLGSPLSPAPSSTHASGNRSRAATAKAQAAHTPGPAMAPHETKNSRSSREPRVNATAVSRTPCSNAARTANP